MPARPPTSPRLGEQLTQLAALVTTIGRTLADDTAALARLEALDRQVTDLAAELAGPGADGKDRYQPGPAPAWWTLTRAERQRAGRRAAGLGRAGVPARLRAPGRHPRPLLAGRTTCACTGWTSLSQLWSALYLQPARSTALLSAQAEYQARILPAIAAQLVAETTGCGHQPRQPAGYPGARHDQPGPPPGPRLRRPRLARLPLPARPEDPGHPARLPRRHHRPASRSPNGSPARRGWNLAIATGAPGPDVLDVDQHGAAGNGFRALARLRAAGLLDGASGYVRTPSGGLHAYFTGSAQRNGHLPAHHLDFLSAGGYVLAPPSQVGGKPYQRIRTLDGHGGLDWQAVIRLLEPDRQHQQPATRPLPDYGISRLVRWVAAQREGNRNAGLFWAANRALEADPAADLSPLAAAARQAGLADPEITRTLNSARRTRHAAPNDPGRQAEGAS